MTKGSAILISIIVAVAIGLSVIWSVPYIYTLIGFSVWAFVGHMVTADDDLPGGWSNPDGSFPFPWRDLLIKGAILAALCLLAFAFPSIRSLGGAS